jgi:ABC-type bacteriocin/lantibiotic exporter with double-glycine peptidase domain
VIRFPCLIFLLFALGCSPLGRSFPDPPPAGFREVSGVPFLAQEERDDCGPAALASLLAHRGSEIPVAQIRKAVYSPILQGTLAPDMENYARDLGFDTRSGRGDLELLRRAIDGGRPVIIPIQAGSRFLSRPHYLVVYGYGPDAFLVHAGIKPAILMDASDLLSRWEKMSFLFLYLE